MAKRYKANEVVVIDPGEAFDEVEIYTAVEDYRPEEIYLVSRTSDLRIVDRDSGDFLISREWA
jgi:hypothetical protein